MSTFLYGLFSVFFQGTKIQIIFGFAYSSVYKNVFSPYRKSKSRRFVHAMRQNTHYLCLFIVLGLQFLDRNAAIDGVYTKNKPASRSVHFFNNTIYTLE